MSPWCRSSVTAFLAFAGLGFGVAAKVEADQRASIWEAFSRRQREAETVTAVWEKQKIVTADHVRAMQDEVPQLSESAAVDIESPAHRCQLTLSGERARYETWGSSFRGGKRGDLEPAVTAFDGAKHQSLINHEYGTVKNLAAFDEWSDVHISGLVLSLRPLRPEAFGATPTTWRIEDRQTVIDTRPCIVLVRDDETIRGGVQRAYLDPARDFVPLRYELARGRTPIARVDMRYERSEHPNWVPSSWTSIFYGGGSVLTQSENQVEEIVLGQNVPDETFVIEYPPGAEVTVVGSTLRNAMSHEERFVAAEEGQLIPLREVLAEESGSWRRWSWGFAVAAGAALSGALLLWRQRRTAKN